MKSFKEVSGTKQFIYGIMMTMISLIAVVSIYAVKESVMEDYDRLWSDGKCFQNDGNIEGDNSVSSEEQKIRNRECMSVRNKVSQVKYGAPVFILVLVIGLLLVLFSFVEIKSSADKAVEAFENEEEKEDDNKLS